MRCYLIDGNNENAGDNSRQNHNTGRDDGAHWLMRMRVRNVIKEILFRAAERVQMPLTLVANQNIRAALQIHPISRVPAGF